MRREPPEVAVDLLASEDFNSILGVIETDQIDFKRSPYRLDEDYQKQELAKDVSALANADGGLLLLGVDTSTDPNHPHEEASDLRFFPRTMVDVERYHAILESWVFPPIQGVQVAWYPAPEDPERGLLGIRIPEQPESTRPFLVVRTVVDDEVTSGVIFGLYRRRRDTASPLSVQEVQSLMRDGRVLRQAMNNRSIETGAPPNAEWAQRESVDPEEIHQERAQEAIEAANLSSSPAMILTAVPDPALELTGLFTSRDSELVTLIGDPPQLRSTGFNIWSGQSHIVRGQLRRSIREESRLLEVWHDGFTLHLTRGDEEFLCWSHRDYDRHIINAVALVESVTLFCRFVFGLYDLSETVPDIVHFTLELRSMAQEGSNPGLPSGFSRHLFRSGVSEAPASEVTRSVSLRPVEESAEEAAYSLLAELYAWFGLEHRSIPFVDRSGEYPRIEPEEILAL